MHVAKGLAMKNRKITLLLVDDEEQFVRSMKKRLEVRDFNVITVHCGEDALVAAREHEIDIALVDLKMPGMGGHATLEALKQEHKWLEVVILTGHGSVESAVKCTKSGAYFYLQKPCEIEWLMEVLLEAYKRRVMNKRNIEIERMDKLLNIAATNSPLGILRKIKELDEQK
jgi:DNA-binding NtrC family response regulator